MTKNKPQPKPKSSDELLTLKGGPTIAEPAYWLCLDLDRRGWELKRQGAKLLVVRQGGGGELTSSDRELIGKWKPQLLEIADYLTTEIATA